MAAVQSQHLETARLLMEAGADVNARDAVHGSPFLAAAAQGWKEMVELALKHGAQVNATDRFEATALMVAVEGGHVEVVRVLLGQGADPNHVSWLDWTALLQAVIFGDGSPPFLEIARLLIQAGANVNLPDGAGTSALAHAQQRDQTEMTALLLDAGARCS